MQAQTTGKQFGSSRRAIGGFLIAAALIAGGVGAATVDDLEVPGFGSDAQTARPLVYDTHVGPRHGEGLPRSIEQAGPVPRAEGVLTSPQGEGFPRGFSEESAPAGAQRMGEGLPRGSGQ